MPTLATLRAKLILDAEGFQSELDRAGTSAEQMGTRLRSVGTAMTAAITLPLAAAGTAAITLASNFQEASDKVQDVFGSARGAVDDLANSFEVLNKGAALDLLGTTGNILTAMGMTRQEAADFAVQIGELARDMSSFNNVAPAEAFQAINAALTGEAESLKRLGIVLLDAEVKKRALADTGKQLVEQLTQEEIVTARLEMITEKAATQVGNYERTKESLANQTRQLRTEIENLAINIGQDLVPAVSSGVGKAQDLVTAFSQLEPETRQLAVQVGLLLAVVGPLLHAVSFLLSPIAKLVVFFKNLNPVVLALSAVAIEATRALTGTQTVFEKILFAGNPLVGLFGQIRTGLGYLSNDFNQFSNVVSGSSTSAHSFSTVIQGTPDAMHAAETATGTLTAATGNLGGAVKAAESEFARLVDSLELERVELTEGAEAARQMELAQEGLTAKQIEAVIAMEQNVEALREQKEAREENAQQVADLISGLEEQRDALKFTEDELLNNRIATLELTDAQRDRIAAIQNEIEQMEFQAEVLRVVAENNAEMAQAEAEHAREVEAAQDRIVNRLQDMITQHLPDWAKGWEQHWQLAKDIFSVFGSDLGGILKGITGMFDGWLSSLGGIISKIGGWLSGLFSEVTTAATAAVQTAATAATTIAGAVGGATAAIGGATTAATGVVGVSGTAGGLSVGGGIPTIGSSAAGGSLGGIGGVAAGVGAVVGTTLGIVGLAELGGMLFGGNQYAERQSEMMAEARRDLDRTWTATTGMTSGALTGDYGSLQYGGSAYDPLSGPQSSLYGTTGIRYNDPTRKQIIEVPVNIDGQEVARVVAPILVNEAFQI